MVINPKKFRRRSFRLQDYDYGQPGFYYITICTKDRKAMLGNVVNGEMCMNKLDQHIVMPNHLHGIIELVESETNRIIPTQPIATPINHPAFAAAQFIAPTTTIVDSMDRTAPLGEIVRTFKAATIRLILTMIKSDFAWQADYYDHIVRNDKDLDRIRTYILNNPTRWEEDRFYELPS
jgi:putative transposase